MCGIAGFFALTERGDLTHQAERMGNALRHRGPDDGAVWWDANTGLALVHRRLAIVDLTTEGRQPMASISGRYQLVFNGEIYNFQALRSELEASGWNRAWRGHSDTEVLLACIEWWGLRAALLKAHGMFALAIWDRERKVLSLARDRLGEKPLYYGRVGGKFLFASELKAIRAVDGSDLKINRESVEKFVAFGYVPSPDSIYDGVFKLLPAHIVEYDWNRKFCGEPVPYWSVGGAATDQLAKSLELVPEQDLIDRVDSELKQSVARQLVADVPLGAFLSGGVDSSLIVSMMSEISPGRVKTFTIGFGEEGFNEAPYAKAVAGYLGTDHHELIVTDRMAQDIIPELPDVYDEPFADSSQIPTILVSRMTHKHVKVALSGDGGDEIFAGYRRYQLTGQLWERTSRYPLAARRGLASGLRAIPPAHLQRFSRVLPAKIVEQVSTRRLLNLSKLIGSASMEEMYGRLMSRWQPEDKLVLNAGKSPIFGGCSSLGGESPWAVDQLRKHDLQRYLPDDLLVKVDRASMSVGLETRAPMLDHGLIELALALPSRMLVRQESGKWILRKVLDKYVPRELIERPKAGFEIPLAAWLRGPLRAWADSMLEPSRLAIEGYFDPTVVQKAWNEHLACHADRSLHLWNILMFESWLERQRAVA